MWPRCQECSRFRGPRDTKVLSILRHLKVAISMAINTKFLKELQLLGLHLQLPRVLVSVPSARWSQKFKWARFLTNHKGMLCRTPPILTMEQVETITKTEFLLCLTWRSQGQSQKNHLLLESSKHPSLLSLMAMEGMGVLSFFVTTCTISLLTKVLFLTTRRKHFSMGSKKLKKHSWGRTSTRSETSQVPVQ